MPNPKRVIAAGRPLYSSFVNYFGDDVSGNRTKSWNKHWNAYMTHVNLPRQLLQQEFHTHFVSTSRTPAAVEVTHTEPVEVQDESGSATRFCLYVNAGPSDNPMQSEISGQYWWQRELPLSQMRVGGTQAEKATNEGYHAIFEAGEPRTKEYILEELEKQVKLGCSGVAKHVKNSQTETGVKDAYTQFWIDDLISRFKRMKKDEPNRPAEQIQAELIEWTIANRDKIYGPFLTTKAPGFDPTRDTPVEILHTILLGIVKYIWHITHTPWSPEYKKHTACVSIHAIRSSYIMQYAGSLVGRQLKTLAQTNIFHIHGLVPDNEFQAWKAAGELSALLWFPEIRNLAEYRRDLRVAVGNVLDIFATIDPSKIVSKVKYHLLVHIDEDVVEFGPLIGLATELFESFNGVFRYCSILSNHLAPSRDIAIQLADQEGLKHRLTGGWWLSGSDGRWERSGRGVREFMVDHPILQRLVGWANKKLVRHGDIKLMALKRGCKERETCTLQSTTAARASNYGLYTPESMWRRCIYVISESLDECLVNSWVFARSSVAEDSSSISGRISDILADTTGGLGCFRDEVYGMPVLVRRHSEVEFSIVPAKNIKFKFNVQHDCRSAKCDAAGVRLRIQERVESDQVENYIIHKSLDRFLINTHAFHNAHLLRATLPQNLRRAKHDELAAQLRENEDTHDDDDTEERPRKKKRVAARRRAPNTVPSAPEPSMVANRGRRVITQTAKARATLELESDEEPSSDEPDDSDVLYDGSDDNYLD
ncbi:hypothetical protein B0H17DRAFT_1158586 [Mycena rosella]|uniref:Uncharacterized protein n=1 Tax=Mycena rosella TaxID=1033263 RepID=A0AAD7DPW9_MYCRO|nr:hypothetical protein B0H17DRAFT_1158586 [Mycena rosella]